MWGIIWLVTTQQETVCLSPWLSSSANIHISLTKLFNWNYARNSPDFQKWKFVTELGHPNLFWRKHCQLRTIPNRAGDLAMGDPEKAEGLVSFFPQLSSLSESAFSLPELRALWQNLKETNIANGRGRLSQRLRKRMHQHNHGDVYKSLGWDGMDPRVMRKLAGVIARPCPIIFERLW